MQVRGTVRSACVAVRAQAIRRPYLVTLLLCLAVLGASVHGTDLPAQVYRTGLVHRGSLLWDARWFGGHALAGYSVLFPPLAAVLGVGLLGLASCVASTAWLTRLLRRGAAEGHELALLWFAVVTVIDLVVGRLPFALGLAFGLAALAYAAESRPRPALLLALLCPLASPLSGAFLLLAAVAWMPAARRQWWPLAFGSGAGLLAPLFLGESGRFPFPVFTLATVITCATVGYWVSPRTSTLRRGFVLYGLAAVVLFVVPNPIGGNVERLSALAAGPVAAFELVRTGRLRQLAVLALPILTLQLAPVPSALATVGHDPSSSATYYAGLSAFLKSHPLPLGRVEVPMTERHWESAFVAKVAPLARGWDRQSDVARNGVLYDDDLTPAAYRDWLATNGVRYVALPDVALDPSSRGEARILAAAPAWLTPVWHDAHWRVWAVADATPLVRGGTLVSLEPSSFTVSFHGPATARVLVRWTRFWAVSRGTGCVGPSGDGWTQVRAFGAGAVTVSARISVDAVTRISPPGSCARHTKTASG